MASCKEMVFVQCIEPLAHFAYLDNSSALGPLKLL